MRIVQINHFSYKAAGNIMMNIHKELIDKGVDSYVVWGRGRAAENEKEYYMNDKLGVYYHAAYTRLTGRMGFASVSSTKKLIKWLEQIKPDIIHLHCIHGYYINIKLLFDYIRKNNIKIVWTQHDCWAFTGHCAYFDMVGCEKWKTGCYDCKQIHEYPASYSDASKRNWKDKKQFFSGLNMKLVAPSKWLKGLISQSFLGDYPVEVIYNGIDTEIFKYTDGEFKTQYQIQDKFMILGVASEWTERKGLKDFIKLHERLDPQKYQIVIVGLTKKQIRELPQTIIGIERTNNVQELVEIYSAADLFYNPTYEEVFGMVNVEALACGTSVLTYQTGGSPESVAYNGHVVAKGDLDGCIEYIETLQKRKKEQLGLGERLFTVDDMRKRYLNIYENLL